MAKFSVRSRWLARLKNRIRMRAIPGGPYPKIEPVLKRCLGWCVRGWCGKLFWSKGERFCKRCRTEKAFREAYGFCGNVRYGKRTSGRVRTVVRKF